MKRGTSWAWGLVLTAGAIAVSMLTPSTDAIEAPFTVRGELGDTLTGRELQVTVTDVRRTHTVEETGYAATVRRGNWIVVDVTAESVREPLYNPLDVARLEVGDVVFNPTRRVDGQFTSGQLHAGIAQHGLLVFEIPADLALGEVLLTFSPSFSYPLLDSQLTFALDLSDAQMEETIFIEDEEWGTG